jgi:hypothetical protein
MADAGAAVDVVRAHHMADELLHEVVFLIRAAGGRDAGDRIATVLVFDAREVGDDVVVSLVPGRFLEGAVGLRMSGLRRRSR